MWTNILEHILRASLPSRILRVKFLTNKCFIGTHFYQVKYYNFSVSKTRTCQIFSWVP